MSNWMHRQIMSEARACDKINRTAKNKQARCDVSKKKDAASRIAAREYAVDMWSTDNEVGQSKAYMPRLERAIRRAITAAVRKERERCVKCVWNKSEPLGSRKIREIDRQSVCEDIIDAIRKGKA